MMLDPSVKFEGNDAFLQELLIGNQKCDNVDDEDDPYMYVSTNASQATHKWWDLKKMGRNHKLPLP